MKKEISAAPTDVIGILIRCFGVLSGFALFATTSGRSLYSGFAAAPDGIVESRSLSEVGVEAEALMESPSVDFSSITKNTLI